MCLTLLAKSVRSFYNQLPILGVGSVCFTDRASRWRPEICCELQQRHWRRGQLAPVRPSTSTGHTFEQEEVRAAPSWKHPWGCWRWAVAAEAADGLGWLMFSCPSSVDKLPQLRLLFKAVPLLSPNTSQESGQMQMEPLWSEGSQEERKFWWVNNFIRADYMMGSHKVSACLLKAVSINDDLLLSKSLAWPPSDLVSAPTTGLRGDVNNWNYVMLGVFFNHNLLCTHVPLW